MELVTADDQLIVISNLDVDLLESEATVLLDDDGMSAQTQGTLFSRIYSLAFRLQISRTLKWSSFV